MVRIYNCIFTISSLQSFRKFLLEMWFKREDLLYLQFKQSTTAMERQGHLDRFYELLSELEDRLGGRRRLEECHGRMGWPRRGVYFFFEPEELREDRRASRVVRVGTHALKIGSRSTLWERLRQHKGYRSGGGNHRGSIFRFHVGTAIREKEGWEKKFPKWEQRRGIGKAIRKQEFLLEKKVSKHIRLMSFLWLEVDKPPNSIMMRGYIEQNAIGLLSNYGKLDTPEALDPPSSNWLGNHCSNDKVRNSGLWNSNHTDKGYQPNFLKTLEKYLKLM